MNKNRKILAALLCLVFVLQSLTVFSVSADDAGLRVLRKGNVTVQGKFSGRAVLTAEQIADPFEDADPDDPWWPWWHWWEWLTEPRFRSNEEPAARLGAPENAGTAADDGVDRGEVENGEPEDGFSALAYYNIDVKEGGRSVHPGDPVTITITDLEIPADRSLQIIHVLDDEKTIEKAYNEGRVSAITAPAFIKAFEREAEIAYKATGNSDVVYVEYYTTADGSLKVLDDRTVSFVSSSFSTYILTETVLETSITTGDGSTYGVTVSYDVRANIPADARLEVSEIAQGTPAYDRYFASAAETMGYAAESLEYLRLFDISIVSSRTREHYQPASDVTVRVSLLDRADAEKALQVVHFADKAELLPSAMNEGDVSFRTDSFSVYALGEGTKRDIYKFYVPTDATQTAYVEYRIYTDFAETTFTQIVKQGEQLLAPQLPSLPESTNSTFDSWYIGTESGGSVTLASDPFDFDNIPDATDSEIHLYARFANFAYVIFHEQFHGATNSWPITGTRRGELINGQTTIRISDVTVAYDDSENEEHDENAPPAMAFRGWTTAEHVNPDNTVDDDAPLAGDANGNVTISANLELFPVFSHINWLSYSSAPSGSGATYYAPEFLYSDTGISSFSDHIPERRGYRFDGWYTAAEGGVQIANASGVLNTSAAFPADSGLRIENGQLMLTKNTMIYGHWSPGPSDYTVVIWQQKASDEVGGEKHYDYYTSERRTANTGASVSTTNADRNYNFTGFQLGSYDGAKTVLGDGSTVLNVYYDRRSYTLTFRGQYTAISSEGTSGTRYGYWNGSFSRIYYRNGAWRQNNRDNGTVYTGTHYTGNNSTNTVVSTITALYQHDISSSFPVESTAGGKYDQGTRWNPSGSSTYTQVLVFIASMPAENISFSLSTSTASSKTMRYYTEALPDKTPDVTRNGVGYSLYNTINANYNYITEAEDFIELQGYIKNGSNPSFPNNGQISGNADFYYLRNTYTVEFRDKRDNGLITSVPIKYGYDVADYIPADPTPPTGYTFSGWYADSACSVRVFFDQESYDAYSYAKVLYDTMPANNLQLFANWTTQWYLIKIDPNGGQLQGYGDYSTWFWKSFGTTESVVEYTNTRRDYIESLNGTWYYAVKDRDFYGLTDEWENREDDIHDRTTYYTQDISDPAIVDLNVKFEYMRDAFRYANWFEVHPDGTETLYNFSTRIDHDLLLKLHWKRVGTYYIRYDAGENGTLDSGDNNEDTFKILDSFDYADHSDVVVTRTAIPNEGSNSNFIGWTIRGDNTHTLYYPGQAFEFQSKFALTQIVDGQEKKYLILDAVYSVIDTAKIIYDANGGVVDPDTVDYGAPTDPTEGNLPVMSCTTTTAMIRNLINNSEITLADGTGFFRENAVIVGWNTEPDASGTHFDLGGEYCVDVNEPVRLYAEWGVKVYFDKNNENANWGGTWNEYTWDAEKGMYYTTALIGRPVAQPPYTPVSSADSETFNYWSLEKLSLAPDAYDFNTPIAGETIIYGFWRLPIEIPTHAVDSTDTTLVNKDAQWLRTPEYVQISGTTPVELGSATNASAYVNVPANYSFAYTCVAETLADVSEANAITRIYYNNDERAVWVDYVDGTSGRLDDEDEIWFVYFLDPQTVNIGYKVMNQDGTLSNAVMNRTGYPETALLGSYAMNEAGHVDRPVYWANNTDYKYFAYAVGTPDATSGAELRAITAAVSTASGDNNRPALTVENVWNGFRYSLDGGLTWVDAGYDVQLYVIYYTSNAKPVLVTVNERTIGRLADLSEEFDYTVTVTKTVTTYKREDRFNSNNYNQTPAATGTPTEQGTPEVTTETTTFTLHNAQSKPYTLFYEESPHLYDSSTYRREGSYGSYRYYYTCTYSITTQTITVTQSPKTGFVTTNDVDAGTPFVYTYTTASDSTNRQVTFTNTRTPLSVEVHVAQIVGGSIVLKDDTLRKNTSEDFTVMLPFGEQVDLTGTSPVDPFSGSYDSYIFAGIVYGTRGGTAITAYGDVSSLTYDLLTGREYGDIFRNADDTALLGGYEVYYLYYQKPRIVYVREMGDGTLSLINPVRYNGLQQEMNGVIVDQNTYLGVTDADFPIRQSGTGFRVPPMLDGSSFLSLDYVKIGAGGADAARTDELEIISENRELHLIVENGVVKYSADGTSYTVFADEPVVYAIYRDRADNTLKIIREDGKNDQDFWYTVTCPDSTVFAVCIPKGADSVTVKGVPYGQYTVAEQGGWSWRYDSEGSKVVRVYNANETRPAGAMIGYTEVLFEGEKTDTDWLNGYDRNVNNFTAA